MAFARFRARQVIGGLAVASLLATAATARAAYIKDPESDLDVSVFRIDEEKYLGTKIDAALPLVGETGERTTLGAFLGKPLVLVLSYYTCDGACSVINDDLRDRLNELARVRVGEDFRVLTLSFDRHDDVVKAGGFRAKLGDAPGPSAGWTFATLENPDDIEKLTSSMGFHFFWSPRDRIFYHPGAFLVLTPEGRLARVLYSQNTEAPDLELAVLEAREGRFAPSEIVNFAVSMCYSYNYKDGKYTLNYPLFIAGGSLALGVSLFSVSAVAFRRKNKKELAR